MTGIGFRNFLYDEDISCNTCKHYSGNTPIKNTDNDVCGNMANHQSGAYSGQYLRLPKDGACHLWEPIENNKDGD
jgi:hypothetical protein